ncbi:hypothetical protein [Sphingomonas sp. KC8]|uniref:hypothetical protein n=1 Tax=Sphingomonas sp. KC8 TaxID=1030157 RepID=UPI0002488AF2|nr:hypothetical protein [Sphingomonas sp. KC8]ARS27956.1 hypothetical protein KC8_11745 [Sphingomonas sp. KC8]
MGNNYYLVAIAAIVIAILAVVLVLRGRGQPSAPPTQTPAAAPREEHHDHITDAAAVATADIAGQFLGIDTTPGGPDDLTRLKGLGPKAAGVLNGMGVSQYAQLAALSPAQIAKIDAAMGAFAGRIQRDQWVEQARLLASGDIPGFEAKFGKLGG